VWLFWSVFFVLLFVGLACPAVGPQRGGNGFHVEVVVAVVPVRVVVRARVVHGAELW